MKAGIIGARRVPQIDIQHIVKATGATLCVSLGTFEGEEAFEPGWLGTAHTVGEEMLGAYEKMLFKGCKTSKAVTIVLRGPNEYMLDEMERCVHDPLSYLWCKRTNTFLRTFSVVLMGTACHANELGWPRSLLRSPPERCFGVALLRRLNYRIACRQGLERALFASHLALRLILRLGAGRLRRRIR